MRYGAVIVTSANALRGFEQHPAGQRLLKLPLFAVGEHTAAAAGALASTRSSRPMANAAALREAVLARVKARELKKASPLLYLAGADLARDLAGDLGERGFTVVTQTTYRMIPVPSLPREVPTALPPTGSRRCCIIRGAALGPSWRPRVPPASKSRRWPFRNAAFPTRSPLWSATPGPPRYWRPGRRTKMPYWTH